MLSPQEYQERCDDYCSYQDDIQERYHREAEDMRKEDEEQARYYASDEYAQEEADALAKEQAAADKAGLTLEAWREAERELERKATARWEAEQAAARAYHLAHPYED